MAQGMIQMSEVEPEEPDGGLAVVVGDASGEEAGDVLVVEIEPGPAAVGGEAEAGGQGDGWIAEGGEDVPGGGDGEEDGGAWEEVEFEEEAELVGDGEVEEDEADGEDEADESLGEDVEGHDGGEGEAGEERTSCAVAAIAQVRSRCGHPVAWLMRSRAMRKRWTARVIQRARRMSGM